MLLLDLPLEVQPSRVAPNLAVPPPPASSFSPGSTRTHLFSHPRGGEWWKSSLPDQSLDPTTTYSGLTPCSGCSLSVSLCCPNNQCTKYFSLKTLSIVGRGKKKRSGIFWFYELLCSWSVILWLLVIIQALPILSITHNLSIFETNLTISRMMNVDDTNLLV